jgi:hypothetical protein
LARKARERRASDESVEECFPSHATAKANTNTVTIVVVTKGCGEFASSGVFHPSSVLLGFFV